MDWKLIQKELFNKKIKNIMSLTDYKQEELMQILHNLSNNTETENNVLTESEVYPSDVSILFKKDWNKLANVHKIIKLKEFSEKISKNKHSKMENETKLINLLKERKLNSKSINYDKKNGVIVGIKNLSKLL